MQTEPDGLPGDLPDDRMDCFSPPGSRVVCDPLAEHAGDDALGFLTAGEVYTVLAVLAEDDSSRVRLFEFPEVWLDARLFRAHERRVALAPGERLYVTVRDEKRPEEWIQEALDDIADSMPGDEPVVLLAASARLGIAGATLAPGVPSAPAPE